jgi:hypothetical protein
LEATGYGVSFPSLDDHPPDIEGFSQIRDDNTKFNQLPQVSAGDTESITQFWENPLISPASKGNATGSHAPPTLDQAWIMCHQLSLISYVLLWTRCRLQNSMSGLPLHVRNSCGSLALSLGNHSRHWFHSSWARYARHMRTTFWTQ